MAELGRRDSTFTCSLARLLVFLEAEQLSASLQQLVNHAPALQVVPRLVADHNTPIIILCRT